MRISDWSSDVCSSDLQERVSLETDQARPHLAEHPVTHFVQSALRASPTSWRRRSLRTLTYWSASRCTARSEERRVGKECVSKCRSRWSPYHQKKTKMRKNV